MAIDVAPGTMSAEEIVALSRKHTLFEWVAQNTVDPIPVVTAKGSYFYSADGKRYLDFNSQLMSVNIGHGDQRVIDAIAAQAQKLAYANPFMAHEPRARLGRKLAELTPGDLDVFFFTNGGAEANENAIKLARQYTGRHKILARYRSYHGATGQVMVATGDPRRWAAETGVSGIVRAPDSAPVGPHGARARRRRPRRTSRTSSCSRVGHTIAGFILEPVVGTNGILIPPDGYLQGVREICDRHGILLIADEVMSGFGRTGAWFAVDHWGVVPDLLTMAKGLTASYLPLGAVAMRQHDRRRVRREALLRWPHLQQPPHGLCRGAGHHRGLRAGRPHRAGQRGWARSCAAITSGSTAKHPSVGAHRNIGLFGILELVRDRATYEPMAPYNGTSDEMKAVGRHLKDNGLYTFVRYNTIHSNPPLTITEAEMAEGFDIIDGALDHADKGVRA